ncbi:hypothetical protein B0H12DRAFT_1242037 [Mycena haematopus]|nr:hypothetical protein B0H12DRAFT_1242037 [Mycena haematopus]
MSLHPIFPVLLIARILHGISCQFSSHLCSDVPHAASGGPLHAHGGVTLVNGLVATGAGIFLALDNYGGSNTVGSAAAASSLSQLVRLCVAQRIMGDDSSRRPRPRTTLLRRLRVLSCLVFFFVSELESPLGYIFSSFILSILGSPLCIFLSPVSTESSFLRFFALCAFEACLGMYYPVQVVTGRCGGGVDGECVDAGVLELHVKHSDCSSGWRVGHEGEGEPGRVRGMCPRKECRACGLSAPVEVSDVFVHYTALHHEDDRAHKLTQLIRLGIGIRWIQIQHDVLPSTYSNTESNAM